MSTAFAQLTRQRLEAFARLEHLIHEEQALWDRVLDGENTPELGAALRALKEPILDAYIDLEVARRELREALTESHLAS
jgi:acetyl-CoA carboxylase carboxyltransferase component